MQNKSPGPKIYVDYQKISVDYLEKQLEVNVIAWWCLWCEKNIAKTWRVLVTAKIDILHL